LICFLVLDLYTDTGQDLAGIELAAAMNQCQPTSLSVRYVADLPALKLF